MYFELVKKSFTTNSDCENADDPHQIDSPQSRRMVLWGPQIRFFLDVREPEECCCRAYSRRFAYAVQQWSFTAEIY